MKKMDKKNTETIIIFTLYLDDDIPYPSFIHSHAKQYVKMGYNVIVFAQKATLPIIHFFKKDKIVNHDGVKIIIGHRLSISGLFPNCRININGLLYYLSVKRKINKLTKNENVILFDGHTFHCEGYTAYLLKKKYPNIKTTITFHGSDLEAAMKSKVEKKRIIKASKYIDSFICVSDKLTNRIKSINIKNVKTVYNGINMFKLHNYQKEKTLISCGSLVESKNFCMLIDSFNIFHKKYPDYKLKIIGSGYLKETIIKKINKYDLKDYVILLGQLSNEEVFKEYEKASIFLLISKPEGFGIVYPEAMYCGCITIGTKDEGIDGFIKNNKNGFLINQNVNEIVKILEYIINNNCDKIVTKGKIDAKKLTWKRNCEEYLK